MSKWFPVNAKDGVRHWVNLDQCHRITRRRAPDGFVPSAVTKFELEIYSSIGSIEVTDQQDVAYIMALLESKTVTR